MQLIVDKNTSEVLGYMAYGGTDNSMITVADVPKDFENNFKPRYYLFSNGAIIVNANYVAPAAQTVKPTAQDEINAFVLKELVDLHAITGGGDNA